MDTKSIKKTEGKDKEDMEYWEELWILLDANGSGETRLLKDVEASCLICHDTLIMASDDGDLVLANGTYDSLTTLRVLMHVSPQLSISCFTITSDTETSVCVVYGL